jgi:hypothetical protein
VEPHSFEIVSGKRARKKVDYDASGADDSDDSDVPKKIKKAMTLGVERP